MADELTASVEGYAELARDTGRLVRGLEDRAADSFALVADKVAAAGRARVPRRSGALAGSVLAEPTGDGALVGMGGSVEYAGWVEFGGTRGRPYIAAGRYFYPAANAAEPLLTVAADKAARDEIEATRWTKQAPPGT